MASIDEIIQFVREQTGFDCAITPATTLQHDIGVFGDDMSEFIAAYSKRFGVDIEDYRWYFHTGEEGWSIGSLFFDPPYARVPHIPITVAMLHDCAERKRWAIDYPEHQLPKRRVDMFINQALVIAVLSFLGYTLWRYFAH